jgi:hypothetical protein
MPTFAREFATNALHELAEPTNLADGPLTIELTDSLLY